MPKTLTVDEELKELFESSRLVRTNFPEAQRRAVAMQKLLDLPDSVRQRALAYLKKKQKTLDKNLQKASYKLEATFGRMKELMAEANEIARQRDRDVSEEEMEDLLNRL